MFEVVKPWYAIATPHEDIRQGRLSEAVFAANLWSVDQGDAPEVYLNTESFFAKTYLTTGLTNVLKKVSRALSGDADSGDRILSLQTSFGGGKTHTLVALWHMAKHVEVVRKAAACSDVRNASGKLPEQVKAVAVFTNQTCDATQGRDTPEGVHTRTLWGELALQLGGVEIYRKIEANDKARTVPQGLFADILRQCSPCLILLDELADYCVGASAVEVGNATLADQTISFVQQLTEAVNNVKGVAVVATLPASHLEVASSERGQEVLNSLERRFGRMGADIKPVADEEIYEVVRRRLFESLGDETARERIVDAYMNMYQQHRNEVPTEATRGTYKKRILDAYPFHPTLIDALYLRWGSHSDFQRTRGVLRLLASIVGDLWQRRNTETQSQPLIQPCHLRWDIDALHAALIRLWGAAYDSVAAADVIGGRANSALLDEERGGEYATEKIGQGLAAAILLGSFGGQGDRVGYSTKDLKLCVSRPTLNWGYTDGALMALDEERAFFLHGAAAGSLGKRYWFGNKPTLNKLVVQYRNQFASTSFDDEIVEAVEEQVKTLKTAPATWRVLVNPKSDLPEQKSLVLLVMPPGCEYADNGGQRLITSPVEQKLLSLSLKCGARDRIYRNTLLFLIPSTRGLSRLRNALREVKALEGVKRDYSTQMDADQVKELDKKLEAANKAVGEALGGAYSQVGRIEGQEVSISPLSESKNTFSDHLKVVWDHAVEDREWVLRKVGGVTLQAAGLIPTEVGISIKDAIEAFLRYTDKPMIASRDAVIEGLKQACLDRLIGIARGVSLDNLQKKWCGEGVMLDANEEGVWIIPKFELAPVAPPVPPGEISAPPGTGVPPGEQPAQPGAGTASPTSPVEQIRRIRITGDVPLDSWADVFRSFVSPAARMKLKKMTLGIDFELQCQDDQLLTPDDQSVKGMKESARQLGLDMEEE
jgi:hypothetical protein